MRNFYEYNKIASPIFENCFGILNKPVIIEKLEYIIELYIDNKYEEVCKLIYPIDNFSNEFQIAVTDGLVHYCVNNQNENTFELFKMIIDKKDPNIYNAIISIEINKYSDDMIDYMLGKLYLDNNLIYHFFERNNIIVSFLDIIQKKGYRFNSKIFSLFIKNNDINAIQYLIKENYDIQTLYNEIDLNDWCKICDININILKFLYLNIDLQKHSNIIFQQIIGGSLDSVMFMVEIFPDLNLDKAFERACIANNIETMKYFLNQGANIKNMLYMTSLYNIQTILFLLEVNDYDINKFNFNVRIFFASGDLISTKCLLDRGAKIDYIFKSMYEYNHKSYHHQFQVGDNSIRNMYRHDGHYVYHLICVLEHIVATGYISHIEFLMENYYELLKPELNRLFVVACANGQIEMVKYLMHFEIEINNKSLIMACLFGHYEIVQFLLENGLLFSSITCTNLFCITSFFAGYEESLIKEYCRGELLIKEYNILVNDNILRNDVYNYGNNHKKIFELLIVHNYSIGDFNLCENFNSQLLEINILKYFLSQIINSEPIDKKFSAVELCILDKKYDELKFLLDNGAKPKFREEICGKIHENDPGWKLLEKFI